MKNLSALGRNFVADSILLEQFAGSRFTLVIAGSNDHVRRVIHIYGPICSICIYYRVQIGLDDGHDD